MSEEMKDCPKCGGYGRCEDAGRQGVRFGCANPLCEAWSGGADAGLADTKAKAVAEWNRWVEEVQSGGKPAADEEAPAEEAPVEEAPAEDAAADEAATADDAATEEAADVKNEPKVKFGRPTRYSAETIAQVLALRAQGKTFAEISLETGVSIPCARRYVKNAGNTTPPSSPAETEVPVDEECPFGPPDEEDAPEEAAGDEEPADAEEDPAEDAEAEETTRFWLQLDDSWYWLDTDEAGCEGCALRLAFGKRQICAAESGGFPGAVTLCRELEGVWKESE